MKNLGILGEVAGKDCKINKKTVKLLRDIDFVSARLPVGPINLEAPRYQDYASRPYREKERRKKMSLKRIC